MKYSAAILAALVPFTVAKAIQNAYPARAGLRARNGHQANGGKKSQGANNNNNGGLVNAVSSTEIIIIWANAGAGAATTTINQAVTVTETVTAGAAATVVGSQTVGAGQTATVGGTAATHSVTVGGAAGLIFVPDQVQAAVGDMVVFSFLNKSHSVTQSSFAQPCNVLAGGMDSDLLPNPDNTVVPPPQVAIQVMSTDPQWFFCKQTGHCGKGMTFSINPTAEKTQSLFQAAAIASAGQGAGSALTGNSTTPADGSSGAGSGAAASSSSAAAAPAATTSAAGGAAATTTSSGAAATGTGTLQAGACVCAVTCGTGSFPAVAAQGIGNFGGFAGAIDSSMLAI